MLNSQRVSEVAFSFAENPVFPDHGMSFCHDSAFGLIHGMKRMERQIINDDSMAWIKAVDPVLHRQLDLLKDEMNEAYEDESMPRLQAVLRQQQTVIEEMSGLLEQRPKLDQVEGFHRPRTLRIRGAKHNADGGKRQAAG